MDILETFIAVLFALIVKEFYDIFISEHIKKVLHKYKISMTLKKVD